MDQHLEKLPNVFNRITGPTYTLTDIIQSGKSSRKNKGGPIKEEYLTRILEYLFPDSSLLPKHPYPKEFESNPSGKIQNPNQEHYRVSMGGIKSSPYDGLVWRLTIALGHCYHVLGIIFQLLHFSEFYRTNKARVLK